ncbi:23S rRNA A1618 N6-methylase RlmF [Streptomyces sp. SAI-135]|jgi:branched-chain amino acid aminotransferase|nr:23S rRNA A1618 N6-methylase RlmF [Streptomyces sp. SAI-090]MDH6574147.1 23S rRNA A1618 N6-methylase RlmF [Streptomyces sp. SAI-117]MDH6581116.1 23S rRNA A1618 N6-methylase RlmF [Streptomyces sp. SAI-133]MDH6613123.1 23S rRNA A1618 N6-methylase RlmF [Streptomyces sp. SAI-135]
MTPVERAVPLTELSAGLADGTVTEVTAAGTAAVITPVMGIKAVGYAFTGSSVR